MRPPLSYFFKTGRTVTKEPAVSEEVNLPVPFEQVEELRSLDTGHHYDYIIVGKAWQRNPWRLWLRRRLVDYYARSSGSLAKACYDWEWLESIDPDARLFLDMTFHKLTMELEPPELYDEEVVPS